ncbi:hypothetical protein TMEN_8394 [Trichophyton mentagrophytes]|uniref:Uncharacterized protein n=1 Tax=Trichophyton interdigitale (strain MR816) TaxID=1215338 RepID=A0A059J8Z8_TRIIM|nr:hypothetical protein H101_06583 [Trichophyton interdigitale H6]KDB24356.1 hypothetical protein H109_03802 [Trichophyton interdigitale MR816]GBF65676.1 hypothetical protein TMEN_8394 [Trichophyton mentagrophytes]
MEPRRDSDFDQIFLHPTTSNRYRGGDSIALSPRNNAAYRRLSSAEEPYLHSYEAHGSPNPATPPTYRDEASRGFGLGIGQPANRPVGGMGEESDLGYHPSHHSRNFSESSLLRESADTSPDLSTAYHRPSPSFNSSFQSYGSDSNTVRIIEPANGPEYDLPKRVKCPTRRHVVQRRSAWLSIAILVLAFYSTAFSAIYFVVACIKPHYGNRIGGKGGLAPSTATLLSALFAKTIELSFVTVFVAFLGQVLSRKALGKNAGGITIADMSMRTWVMQPGTLITHWENVKHSALTLLGIIAMTTTFVAMFYTTAAEALVSPRLTAGIPETRELTGEVNTKFANSTYLFSNCQSPVPLAVDPVNRGSTCMQIAFSGRSFHNYEQYLGHWTEFSTGQGSTDMLQRPPPSGTWYDNTTVKGSWIEPYNMTELSIKWGRMVVNVTAAMPHAGIFSAARHPKNNIRLPEDLGGQGGFNIKAAIPSPIVNVICAGMTEEELAPIIYTKWPHPNFEFNASTWLMNQTSDMPNYPDWLNATVVDDIFEFGEKFGDRGQRPPIFPKLPVEYNTIINVTGRFETNSIYLLGTSPPSIYPPHYLCQMKGGLTPQCLTKYEAASSGGVLYSQCGKAADSMTYQSVAPDAPPIMIDKDWKNVAEEWARSIALNTGLSDGYGSNARLLSQLIPNSDIKTNISSLDPHLPSVAEALAAMASSLLLLGTQDATFSHKKTFADSRMAGQHEPMYEQFHATVWASDYASGANSPAWQNVFYAVLALVLVTNLICSVYLYLAFRGIQLTDFTEPQNTLALALNSPPSIHVSGACGAGPEGKQLTQRWMISMDEKEEHYYMTSAEEVEAEEARLRQRGPYNHDSIDDDNVANVKNAVSPKVSEYRRISRASSSISLLT